MSIVDSVFRDNDVAIGSFDDSLFPGNATTAVQISNSIFENNRGMVGGFPESRYPQHSNLAVEMSDSVMINTAVIVDRAGMSEIQITRSRMGGSRVAAGDTRIYDSEELGNVAGYSVELRDSQVTGDVRARNAVIFGSSVTGRVGDYSFGFPNNTISLKITNSGVGVVKGDHVELRQSSATSVAFKSGFVRDSTVTGTVGIAIEPYLPDNVTIRNSTIFPGRLRMYSYDGGNVNVTIRSSIISKIDIDSHNGAAHVESLGNNIFGSVHEWVELDLSDQLNVPTRLSGPWVDESGKLYYTPLLTSPAIDAGFVSRGDQLGNMRNIDGDGDGIPASDIGAIESPTMFTADHFAVNFSANPTLRANALANDEGTRSLVAVNNLSSGISNGEFGTLNWDENGDFTYTVETTNPAVANLTPGETLEDAFVIRVSDGVNELDGALYITLTNNTPAFGVFPPALPITTQTRNDDVDLGDLDGDGDLDAFVTVRDGGNQVWLNDGTGQYVNSGQSLGNASSIYADLADLDNDGDLDAVVAALDKIFVWLNVGSAQFELYSQFDVTTAIDVTLNDFDSDGDQDLFVAQLDTDLVFLNDGSGNLIDSGQRLGNSRSKSVEMGDVDGDGDLDAVIGTNANPNGGAPNHIWLNDGTGIFTASPHSFGNSESQHVALGDLDGDGDLDAISANAEGLSDPNVVWLNDGLGRFTDTGQRLGNSSTSHIALADLDDDGDLDAYAANWSDQPDRLWFNDGLGIFTQGQSLGMDVSSHVAMGDIDGDSKPDAVVATFDTVQPLAVWRNQFQFPEVNDDDYELNLTGWDAFSINVLDNDDAPLFPLRVVSINEMTSSNFPGQYGTVNWNENGEFEYTIDTNHPAVADLDPDDWRSDNDQLEETFTYVATDGISTIPGVLSVVIRRDEAVFIESQGLYTETRNEDIDLGDLDDDGDLDAFVTVRNGGNQVWLNNGLGTFTNSGQSLGTMDHVTTALIDIDRDGDLDAVVAGELPGDSMDLVIWSNDGSGMFVEQARIAAVTSPQDIAVGDFDEDGWDDLFIAQASNFDKLLINNRDGGFVIQSDNFGSIYFSTGVEISDIDNDGHLDVVLSKTAHDGLGAPNRTLFGRGDGSFIIADWGGESATQHVAVASQNIVFEAISGAFPANRVWRADRTRDYGTGDRFGDSQSNHVALADFDGNGILDALTANTRSPDVIWLNIPNDNISRRGQSLGSTDSSRVVLGDIDGDSDIDALVATLDPSQPVVVWINRGDLPNDLDGNSVLNSDDLDHVCVAIRDGINDFRFDIDENGIIDQADLLLLQSQLQIGFGDINADGVTDVSDFAIWNVHKFSNNDPLLAGAGWSTGDLNCDGATDISDFNIWNEHKFSSLQRESPAFDVSRLANPNDSDSDSRAKTASVIDQVFRS